MNKPVFEIYNQSTKKWLKIYANGKVYSTDKIGTVINRLPELLAQPETLENALAADPMLKRALSRSDDD